MGFVDPPLVFTARGRRFAIDALNERGRVLIPPVLDSIRRLPAVRVEPGGCDRIVGEIDEARERFPEEARSRQPSVFSVLRGLADMFSSSEDQHLGLYGAFGYDLVFQFEPMPLRLARPDDQRDLVLYLPDEILVVDHMRQAAAVHRYEFAAGGLSTEGLPRSTPPAPYALAREQAGRPLESDHGPGEYAALVERAKEAFIRGDLFEVVRRAAARRYLHRSAERRVSPAAPGQSGALWRADQPGRGRIPSRSVARDVRSRRRQADRDLPDQRHDRARARPGRGRRAHPRTAQFGEGRERADDVHRCRPQRQVAGLRGRQRAGHRPAPDRALFAADPHRRPCRGRAARGVRRPRRVSQPRLGGHRDRRAQALGHPLYRGARSARRAAGMAGRSGG